MATTPTILYCYCCWFHPGGRPKEPDGDSIMAHCNNNYSNDDTDDDKNAHNERFRIKDWRYNCTSEAVRKLTIHCVISVFIKLTQKHLVCRNLPWFCCHDSRWASCEGSLLIQNQRSPNDLRTNNDDVSVSADLDVSITLVPSVGFFNWILDFRWK